MEQRNGFNEWCIVELFGHQRMAGLVSEQTIGGCAFVRVDVPEANGQAAFTRYLGQGSIYAMTPVGEDIARQAASSFRPAPVQRYELPSPKAASHFCDDCGGEFASDDVGECAVCHKRVCGDCWRDHVNQCQPADACSPETD